MSQGMCYVLTVAIEDGKEKHVKIFVVSVTTKTLNLSMMVIVNHENFKISSPTVLHTLSCIYTCTCNCCEENPPQIH